MSADDDDQTSSEESSDQQQTSSEAPELSEEGKEEVRRMQDAYDESRPTAVMPGTDRTITGTAVSEWLDDEGNPKFGKEEQEQREAKSQEQEEGGSQQQQEGGSQQQQEGGSQQRQESGSQDQP
jgi:hypothetical protein